MIRLTGWKVQLCYKLLTSDRLASLMLEMWVKLNLYSRLRDVLDIKISSQTDISMFQVDTSLNLFIFLL